MTNVPEAMPLLKKGAHDDPKDGACVMEYVSILAGEEFDDHPECTHPSVAGVARYVNDYLHDEDRHLLVPFIDRLMKAAPFGPFAAFTATHRWQLRLQEEAQQAVNCLRGDHYYFTVGAHIHVHWDSAFTSKEYRPDDAIELLDSILKINEAARIALGIKEVKAIDLDREPVSVS